MQTLITYGSQYGSAAQYAQSFARLTGFPVLPYDKVKSTAGYDRLIHFGALYAGGVLGLKRIVPLLAAETEFILVTVGLADVQDIENTGRIKNAIRAQIPAALFQKAKIFHLRGAIDYKKLHFRHRAMMALLYAKAKNLPEEQKNAEVRAMIETYGKQVSFVNDADLRRLADALR